MDRVQPLVLPYLDVMARYLLAGDDVARELALGDAEELGRGALGEGPAVDQMIELHMCTQAALADLWQGAHLTAGERAARERMARGEATPLLVALKLPHQLAQMAHHERRWRREHDTLHALFQQTDDMILIIDAAGQIDDVNPAFSRMTGFSPLEAVTSVAAMWRNALPQHATELVRAEQGRRNGSSFMAEWSVSPVFGRDGKLISHVCIGRDVTRQQQIEDGLRENDKLRAVATLAGGIAHDFNNLLGSVLGLAELCELDAVAGSRQARNLARIRQAATKAATLVRQMLDFSRQTPHALQRVAFGELLRHAGGLLHAALPQGVRLDTCVVEDGEVLIDLVQMEQVLLNMAGNAAYAMRERGGVVSLKLDRLGTKEMRLRIADTGEGIAPELLTKIFEPFFTTKPVGEGTGLGLAAAHGIVSAHGGRIEVASECGRGTTFSIRLPRAAPVAADDIPSSPQPRHPQTLKEDNP